MAVSLRTASRASQVVHVMVNSDWATAGSPGDTL